MSQIPALHYTYQDYLIWTQQVIFGYKYIYKYICMHVIKINENRGYNLKKTENEYSERQKGGRNIVIKIQSQK